MAVSPFTRFITSDYIKAYTFLNGSIEESYLNPAVRLAMDKYIQDYLGTDLYKKLQSDISGSTLSGDYLTLMDDYVRICATWWTVVEMLPNIYVKIDNGGLVQHTSDDAVPGDQSQLTRLLKQARESAEHYTKLMLNYLCKNSTLFPEFTTNDEDQLNSGGSLVSFEIS